MLTTNTKFNFSLGDLLLTVPEVFFGAVSAHKNQMMKLMNRLLLVLAILGVANFAAAQIRPDLAPLEENPDTSNFEVYSQKNGNLRRATLMGIGKYVLENLSLSYDSNNNRIVISEFGTASDTITLENVDITASLSSDDTLSINDTDIYLGGYDNSLTFDSGTKTLFLERRGPNNSVSLASLTPSLSLSGTTLSYGNTDISLSAFNQTLSLNSSTDILSISNASGGGASTVDLSEYQNLSAVSTVSYFGGDGTSGSPLELNDASVPVSKLGTISTSRLLGRYSSGTGGVQPIIIGSGLNLSASGELSASSGDSEREELICDDVDECVLVRYVGSVAPTVTFGAGAVSITVPNGTIIKSFSLYDSDGSNYSNIPGDITFNLVFGGYTSTSDPSWGILPIPAVTIIETSNGVQIPASGSGYQTIFDTPNSAFVSFRITGFSSIGGALVLARF